MSGYIGNIPVPQATQTRDVFTATSGQTSFATSGYTPGYLDVWLNGVKLVNGTDFTATNGSDVVLSSGAATSDIVEVLSYSTYEVNNQAFTGDFSVDGTTFKVDSTNNRVAVGTSTPDSTFVVNGSGARQKITDGTNTLSMGQFDGLTNQIGSAGRDLYLLTSGANNIKFGTNNTERMNLDSSGRLTLPYQVGFKASGLVSSPTPPSLLVYNDLSAYGGFNRGGHYSNTTGRFTAPIAGVYLFSANAMGNSNAGRLMLRLVLNSADAHQGSSSSNGSEYQDSSFTVAVYLNANDYVEVKLEGPKGLHGTNPLEYYFTGLLIG